MLLEVNTTLFATVTDPNTGIVRTAENKRLLPNRLTLDETRFIGQYGFPEEETVAELTRSLLT